jgi:tRNA A-37 threonylcarbamoyl transferase component Bud32
MTKLIRRWTISRDWEGTEAAVTFASLDKVFALEGERVTLDPVSEVIRYSVGEQLFYVKRYFRTEGLRSWVGQSRIRLEWRNLLKFKRWGIPAAPVVAYGEDRYLSRTLRGAMITAGVENTLDLATMVQQQSPLLKDPGWVDRVSRQVADATRNMHDRNFAHTDLKWRNILVTQDLHNPKICMIDCPSGTRWFGPMLKYRLIKDLACLDKVVRKALSRTQRLAFYKYYSGHDRLTPADKRILARVTRFFAGRD